MIFLKTFLNSLRLPKKDAVFQLNRVGMDIVVVYLFILIAISSIPELIEQITTPNVFDISLFFYLIYFFIFYYLVLTVLVFSMISLIAYLAKKLASLMQRKLHYSILWKMTALSTTVPFLLYTIIALIFPVSQTFLWLSLVYTFFILVNIILIYPKRRITK